MSHFAPLLAANDAELVKFVIIVVFGILVGIAKFIAMINKGKPPAAMGQRPAPPPVAKANAGNEIEEFMRRAAARPRTAAGAAPIRQPPQARPTQPRPPAEKPVPARVISDEPVGARIAKEVDRDLDNQEFTDRSNQLGSEVTQAIGEIDQHLHEVFDHHVSSLEFKPGESAAEPMAVGPAELSQQPQADLPSLSAASLSDLLADPTSVSQAIILSELLHRPEERW